MSSLIINWRFGGWFLQIDRPGNWGRGHGFRLEHVPGRPGRGEALVALYQGRRYAVALAVLAALLIWWAL
jgi:hypothetical protein